MEIKAQQLKGSNKINYRQKNLDFIEKIKQKKQRQIEEKSLIQKKQQQRRQTLKKRILQQAVKSRQNKLRELKDLDNNTEQLQTRNNRLDQNFQSLPKIHNGQKQKQSEESINQKKNYQEKYLQFLQSLNSHNKSKKQIEQNMKKKKEQKVSRLKQELGYDKIDSKLGNIVMKKQKSQSQARSLSAQKFESMIGAEQNELPKTNTNFKKKNEEYIEKIKKRRQQQQRFKLQQKAKKDKLKQKLKDYVMTTVKKNVLQGVYDDEFEKKGKKSVKEIEEGENENENEQESSQEESRDQQTKKRKRKMRNFPYVTDLTEWKKKNRLEDGQKVFIVTGGYPELKKSLRERGWVQNPDCHSPCFDMKYTLQGRQIDYKNLLDFQIVNHYEKNGVITTKIGLTKTLRNSIWINDISEDSFYPKCFDLNDEDDYIGFEVHFKVCKALSILKIYADSAKVRKDQKVKQQKKLLQDLKMRTQVAISVCLKNIQDLDQIIDKKKSHTIVTQKQWQILASDELNQEQLAKKKHQQWLKSIDCKFGGINNPKMVQKDKKKKKPKKQKVINKEANEVAEQEQQEQSDQLLQKVEQILEEYKNKFPQFYLTGHNNIWILKPAGLSRGRGITCYNNFVEIHDHIKCKESLWIAQKYIQNPFIVLKRKFDIRQWVLVTDFNPLTIWIYDECYVRFSAIDYDPKQVHNKFIHLTNNSIGAYYKDFDKSHIKGNMFCQQEFSNYIKQKQGADIFQEKIKPQIKQIIKQSLLCSLDGIENRKNTHQLFGYDFMIDDNYKVWLIEINSSPSMDYSTHVTAKLVKEGLSDLVKVIVDHASAPKKEKKHIDTGKFKRIYKGIEVNEKVTNAGLNLCLQGVAMKKPKKSIIKPQNINLQTKQ